MNNDLNRNVRTLIVSFVFALMVMVPLRFMEVGQIPLQYDQQVLGESVEMPVIESDCLSNEYVDRVVSFLDWEKEQSDVVSFESRRCR